MTSVLPQQRPVQYTDIHCETSLFFDSQCIHKNIAKSQHRFYGKTFKHPGAEPRFYGKTFKFWRNISVRNDCIFNCFKGRLPQKPQICANLLALGGVQTVKCHPPVWRRHCQLVMTGRWLRSYSDWHVNQTILVRFSTDSARDVWRHTSHQQRLVCKCALGGSCSKICQFLFVTATNRGGC